MEKYINMDESFGGKLSASSTNSFQTSYEQCIESLEEQVENHKKVLVMAQKLLEHYKQENQQLRHSIEILKEEKNHAQQKYEILQKLFLKFDKQKGKQMKKQTRRSHEKHFLQVKLINSRYEDELQALKQKIFHLENELKKYLVKQKEWKQFQKTLDREIQKDFIHIQKRHKQNQNCLNEVKKMKYIDLNQNLCQTEENCETLKKVDNFFQKKQEIERNRTKIMSNSCQAQESFNRVNFRKKDQSLTNKDKRTYKTNHFMTMSAYDDYNLQKQDAFRTVQKNKKSISTYDNFSTEYKRIK